METHDKLLGCSHKSKSKKCEDAVCHPLEESAFH